MPVGRPVVLRLKADDVIHSFWVPNLHGKKDLIPGRTTTHQLPRRPARPSTAASAPSSAASSTPTWRSRWSPSRRRSSTRWAAAQRAARAEPADATRAARPARSSCAAPASCATRSRHDRRRAQAAPTSRTSAAARRSPPARCRTRAATWRAGSPIRSDFKPGVNMPATPLPATTCTRWSPTWRALQVTTRSARIRAATACRRRPTTRAALERHVARSARACSAGCRASTTRRSAALHRHRVRLLRRSAALLAAADAAAAGAARQPPHRPGSLQPDLHHARHDDDVPVRRAGDAGDGASTSCR